MLWASLGLLIIFALLFIPREVAWLRAHKHIVPLLASLNDDIDAELAHRGAWPGDRVIVTDTGMPGTYVSQVDGMAVIHLDGGAKITVHPYQITRMPGPGEGPSVRI